MMFLRNCLTLVTIIVTVSSFAPQSFTTTTSRENNGQESFLILSSSSLAEDTNSNILESNDTRELNQQREESPSFSETVQEPMVFPCREFIAASLIFGSLFMGALPNNAMMTTPSDASVSQYISRTAADPKPFTAISEASSSLTLSDEEVIFRGIQDLKIQPKYLDLAGEFKEELKFRANQGKEKIQEEAKKAQEKAQAAAAERDAKNAAFDAQFDVLEKERNEYFRSRIISRDAVIGQVQEQISKEDRNQYNRMIQALGPDATPVQRLRYQLERDTEEVTSLKKALAENDKKNQDINENKVERAILKINLEKAEQVTAKLRKDIALEESLETIKAERAAEVQAVREKANIREQQKQEKIQEFQLAKEKDREAFKEMQVRKKAELEDLKFANKQILFERQFDDLDKFVERKKILEQMDKQKTKSLVKELNQLAAEDTVETTP